MADITAQLVKDLRDKTGAGMMDCKKALAEVAGDLEAAIDWLRKKGLSAAAKKAGRVAAEGLVAIAAEGTRAVALEVNAETDFVGRNEQFQSFVLQAAKLAIAAETLEALQAMPYPGSARNVADELTQLVATIGENMTMRRMAKLSVAQGVVATYVHTAVAPNVGRIAVLVALESAGDAAALLALGKQIAMHIAAAKPDYLNIADVPPEAVEREKNVLTEQALASGKPAQAIEKMVEGRLRKFYEEVVLNEQAFVMDDKRKISAVVADAAKDVGAPITLKAFVRYNLGEGIEKEQADFAAEVAKMAS